MDNNFIDIEYQVLFSEVIPKRYRSDHKSTVSVLVYEVHSDTKELVSMIGTFNFKLNVTKSDDVEEELYNKIEKVVKFRNKQQRNINKLFKEIVASFNN